MDEVTRIDLTINLFIQEKMRADWLTPPVRFFTMLNNSGLLVIGTVLLFLIFRKYREVGMVMGISLALEFILNNLILKPLIARPRPYEVSEAVVLLVERASDYSFPSGHTGSAFAISIVLWLLLSKKAGLMGIVAIFLSILMGLSRLYVGIHYPSDVIGGVFLGIATAFLAVWINKKYFENKKQAYLN